MNSLFINQNVTISKNLAAKIKELCGVVVNHFSTWTFPTDDVWKFDGAKDVIVFGPMVDYQLTRIYQIGKKKKRELRFEFTSLFKEGAIQIYELHQLSTDAHIGIAEILNRKYNA